MQSEFQYALIPAWAFRELDHTTALVYGTVLGLSGKEGYCWATNEYIGGRLNLSRATVKRCIAKLIIKGLLDREVDFNDGRRLTPRLMGEPGVAHSCEPGGGGSICTTPRLKLSPYNKEDNKEKNIYSPKRKKAAKNEPPPKELPETTEPSPPNEVTFKNEELGTSFKMPTSDHEITLSALGPACVEYWVGRILEYIHENPAYAKKKNRNWRLVIKRWHEGNVSKGKQFVVGPEGPGYFASYVIDRWLKEGSL